LDLGDRNSWYCVLDEAGQIQLEQRVRTHAKALQEVFSADWIDQGGAVLRSRAVLYEPGESQFVGRVCNF
jgi:hypothetical protein